jgi:formylglycine-generating enzyme required for sulfatase activity
VSTKSLTSHLVQLTSVTGTDTHPQPAVSHAAGARARRRAALPLLLAVLSLNYSGAAAVQPVINNLTISGGGPLLSIVSEIGLTNRILSVTNLTQTNWTVLTELVVTQSPYSFLDASGTSAQQRFYRVVALSLANNAPPGMVYIPAGSFQMGDSFNEGDGNELPVHTVFVSAYYMDKYEVSGALWDKVKAWGGGNGYGYDGAGATKGTNHPMQTLIWYDMVKWCNARSEMEGRVPAYYTDAALTQIYKTGQVAPFVNWNAGYRLPAEAEWERASRGGAEGHRFPWTDTETISESQANYYSDGSFINYDIGPTSGFNPTYNDGTSPFTSPVGSFAPNGFGVYDMAGNVWEWCWDWFTSYTSDSQTDPRGPATGSTRVGRGGNWNFYALHCRNAYRFGNAPTYSASNIGFRCARAVAQP